MKIMCWWYKIPQSGFSREKYNHRMKKSAQCPSSKTYHTTEFIVALFRNALRHTHGRKVEKLINEFRIMFPNAIIEMFDQFYALINSKARLKKNASKNVAQYFMEEPYFFTGKLDGF